MIVLDGTSMTCANVAAIGRRLAHVEVGALGRARAEAAALAARAVHAHGVYGRTTGVGANKSVQVRAGDASTGLRLARSHASGAGPVVAPEISLGMLAIRANQIAVGGAGIDAGVLEVLADCVNRGLRPPVRRYGAIGTGDLPALAVTVLCLLGERDWLDADIGAPQPRFALDPGDMLAFLSSNAATLAEAAIACHDMSVLLDGGTVIAALGHLAAGASTESYADAVQRARPHPGQVRVAAELRVLLDGHAVSAVRIQDSYGYRALPHVHGAAVDAIEHATNVVARDLNAATENPLIDVEAQRFWHNGNFHTAYVALGLDAARAAVFQAASLSVARLGALLDDRTTGLTPFLARDTPPSSGLMVVEYSAHSALADIRRRGTRRAGRRRALHRHGGARRLRHAGRLVGHGRRQRLPGRPGVRAHRRCPCAAAAKLPPSIGSAPAGVRPR